MLPHSTQKQRDFREQTGNDKLCSDCASAIGSMVGSYRQAHKKENENGDVGFFVILNIILNVILELRMHPAFHCDFLWAPWVVILAFFWRVGNLY